MTLLSKKINVYVYAKLPQSRHLNFEINFATELKKTEEAIVRRIDPCCDLVQESTMSKLVFKSDLFQCDRIVVKKLVFYNRSVETANHIAGGLPSGYEHGLYYV